MDIKQQRENLIPHTFGLEDNNIKHEIIDMNVHELRDELPNRKLTNQPFLCEGMNDVDGKLVETNMPFKNIEAFESYLESVDERFDEGSIIVQEADIFIETNEKNLIKSKEVIMVKEVKKLTKKLLHIKVGIAL